MSSGRPPIPQSPPPRSGARWPPRARRGSSICWRAWRLTSSPPWMKAPLRRSHHAPPSGRLEDPGQHLGRQALIYVRQSTPIQVRENTASTARQYDLARRARELGWPESSIQVIDQDQAHSAATSAGRDGFRWLIAQVGLGLSGAVFSLEASRLARSCSDWYRLLELCALTDTLIIDEEGVYDPTQYNDRLLLGFKSSMK